MIVEPNLQETKENIPNINLSLENLRTLRNTIVGSFDNKIFHLQNGNFGQILNAFLSPNGYNQINLESMNLIISIINSYIISNSKIRNAYPKKMEEYEKQFSSLASNTLKVLISYPLAKDTQFLYENSFRLLANLLQENLFNIEESLTTFIANISNYLINDIFFQSICLILSKICEKSEYIHLIIKNDKLIEKLIDKFYSPDNFNINMNKALIKVLISLTEEEDEMFSNKLIEGNSKQRESDEFVNVLNKGIRYFDIELKILYIKLMTNILTYSKSEKIKNILLDHPIVMWSISILLQLINGNEANDIDINKKISCVSAMIKLLKYSKDFQINFYNLQGIDLINKELKSLYTETQIKDIEEKVKTLKANKSKKKEKDKNTSEKDEDVIISNDADLDINNEYKRVLIECLANSAQFKEEAKKKIIDSKELNFCLDILSDPSNPSKLILSSSLLILSLSRAHLSVKKFLLEHDITSLLFRLTSHSNVDIQIQTTNSLCNFLLEMQNSKAEILECVSRLLKIFNTTKHKKIRFNSVCALKNIFYSVNSKKDIKKDIMEKITYPTLLTLLDDQDTSVQEQALLIFRVLLYNTNDEIKEVFSKCKSELLNNIFNKLNDQNSSDIIIVYSLYILSNISNNLSKGDEEQKKAIDKKFLEKIVKFGNENKSNIVLVCMYILNNLMSCPETQSVVLEVEGIMQLLEKIAFGVKEKNENLIIDINKETNFNIEQEGKSKSDDSDMKEAKQIAMGMIASIKNNNKK